MTAPTLTIGRGQNSAQPGRWLIVVLLFIAVLVNYVDRGNLSIVAVPLMQEFHIAPGRMGTLLSAFFFTYAFLQIPAGWMVDRFGLKWTYGVAFLLWSLASAAVGFASSFEQILALRLLLGAGEATAAPASLAYIRRNFAESEQGLPTAIYLAGMMLGPAIGALLGTILLQGLGWRLLFILTGIGALVWLVPWLMFAPHRMATPAKQVESSTAEGPAVSWGQVLAKPTIWGIAVGSFFYSYYWYFCLTWLPSYLVMSRGYSFLKMGFYTSLPLLLTAVMSLTFGRIADRMIARSNNSVSIRKRFVCVGFLLGASIAIVPLVSSSAAVFATLILSLTGVGIASANFWALTQAASPASLIGRVIGAQNTLANVAGICAPMATGYLVEKTKSFDLALAVAGIAMLIAATCFLLLVREKDARTFRAMSV